MDDAVCKVQKNMEIIKREIAVDQFQLRCVVENVPAARRQFLYLLNNYTFLTVQKRRCLPPAAAQPRTTGDLCQAFNSI